MLQLVITLHLITLLLKQSFIHTSRVPVEGKSSVCLICMKSRIIILIIIIISLGQILVSYNSACVHDVFAILLQTHHVCTHARACMHARAHTHRRLRSGSMRC